MFSDRAGGVPLWGRMPWGLVPLTVAALGGVALGQEAREVVVRVRFMPDPPLSEDELRAPTAGGN